MSNRSHTLASIWHIFAISALLFLDQNPRTAIVCSSIATVSEDGQVAEFSAVIDRKIIWRQVVCKYSKDNEMQLKWLLSIFLLCISFQVNSQELFSRSSIFGRYAPEQMEAFQDLKPTNTVGGYPLPMMGYEYQHLLSGVEESTGVPIQMGREYAIAVRQGSMLSTIEIIANLDSGHASNWTDEPCKRTDYLWKRSIGRAFEDVNCVSINHIVKYFVDPTGKFQQILHTLKNKNITVPPTIIQITFTRYSRNGQRLVYIVNINPEMYGVDRDASAPWGSNSWYKDFIGKDSKKIELLNRLKPWAEEFQNRMNSAFEKRADAFAGLKTLDDYLMANTAGDTPGAVQRPANQP